MSGIASLALLLALIALPALAGDFGATFTSRLACPYSSFVVGEVSKAQSTSITVKVVRELHRRPSAQTFKVAVREGREFRVGEHLLINCWDFPARNKVDWTTFPNSLYRKGLVIHPLASIAADGALTAEGMTDRAGLAMLQWLMVHDRWDVRFETTGDEATVVLSDGQRQQIYSAARDARTAPAATSSQRFGGPLRKGLPRAVWPIAGMIAFMAVLVAFLMRRRRATI